MPERNNLPTRRGVLHSLLGGSLLLPGMLSNLLADSSGKARPGDASADPLAPKPPHFDPKAKQIILIYSSGGVSQMDSFDYKPKLFAADGKMTGAGGALSDEQRVLLKPLWEFRPGGDCGTLVSDLFPCIRDMMDDICLIRSMHSDHNEHYQASLGIHTGSLFFSRPSLGCWLSYGLGTMNQNLPSFIAIAPKLPYGGALTYANDFLPAYHQGVRVIPGPEPIENLERRTPQARVQELELGLADALNRKHLHSPLQDQELASRIRTFETAFRMQTDARDVFDISSETDEVHELYGLKRGQADGFGWQCLVARRLAERGVRFIELADCGSNSEENWDQHAHIEKHATRAAEIDRPIAGLLKDLKRRGMLEETLLIWTTEFGRTPGVDGTNGRGHHRACYSSWLAGGGIKPGISYGQTDELAATVAENPVHFHDFHATILHLMGIDHTKLTYRHAGRDFRLTDVHGRVVHEILA